MTTPPRWYYFLLSKVDVPTGFDLLFKTDSPCHIWLGWSANPHTREKKVKAHSWASYPL